MEASVLATAHGRGLSVLVRPKLWDGQCQQAKA